MTKLLDAVFFPNSQAAIDWSRKELIPALEQSITFREVRKFDANRDILRATTVVRYANRLEVYSRVRPVAVIVADHFKKAGYDAKFRVLTPGRYWVTVYLPVSAPRSA